jgi:ABC-type branched-subunit amino acid transport system substrate-binding protein
MIVRDPSRFAPDRRAALLVLVLSATALAIVAARAADGTERPAEPFFDATARQVEYAGPGREEPEPADPGEVLIGYFGPDDPDHPEGGDLWLAASLAVEEANRAGGYRDAPFRLVPAWSENPWGTGVGRLARTVYEDGVWAVMGSIDGASTHLAEQVVAKARLTLISPASTDKTVNLANVAWMFSCLPSDGRQADIIGRALIERAERPFVLISGTDHDSRVAAREISNFLGAAGAVPDHHFEIDAGSRDLAGLAGEVAASAARAVLVLAGPVESARLVVALRDRRDDLQIFGGASMGRRVFLESAGAAAEGVVFPRLCEGSASSSEFGRAFRARSGRLPDCAAAQTYDATRLLIEAIGEAGLNRARIRDAIEAASPWSGQAAGTIDWDLNGQNRRAVRLATVSGGAVVPL